MEYRIFCNIRIDRVLTPGIRCTVKLDPKAYETKHKTVMKGKVVSPTTPRDTDGIYWGYTTRMASSINSIFEECPYAGGYDVSSIMSVVYLVFL